MRWDAGNDVKGEARVLCSVRGNGVKYGGGARVFFRISNIHGENQPLGPPSLTSLLLFPSLSSP